MAEGLITVHELASRLQVTEDYIYRLVGKKAIPVMRVGGIVRFDWADVVKSMKEAA